MMTVCRYTTTGALAMALTGCGAASGPETGAAGVGGDFDGDGAGDLAIGVPVFPYASDGRPGHVAVFFGPLPRGQHSRDDADALFRGSDQADGFGRRLAAGDTDGDGIDDLVVGAPSDSTIEVASGAVYLFLGGTEPLL